MFDPWVGKILWIGRGSALSRLGAELELRRSGSSLGPSQYRDKVGELIEEPAVGQACEGGM